MPKLPSPPWSISAPARRPHRRCHRPDHFPRPELRGRPEFAANLLRDHRDAANRISKPNGGREHFDLPGFVFDHLANAGVGLADDLAICTYAEPKKYFSHRYATHKATNAGRQLSVIGLGGL